MNAKRTVLLIEDDDSVRFVIRAALAYSGFHVVETRCGSEALERATMQRWDAIVCDYNMPGLTGIETIHKIRSIATEMQEIPALLVSGSLNPELEEQLHTLGNAAFLGKPFALSELTRQVQMLCRARATRTENCPAAASVLKV